MTLSRTARILIAILLLAAAAFFWVNFFYRDGVPPVNVEAPDTPGADEPRAGVNGAAPIDEPASDDGDPAIGAAPDASPAGAEATDGDPTVVIPETPEVVTRDVEVAELPFLVTEPPAALDGEEAAAAGGAAAGARPTTQRVSVNPFSPIMIQAAAPEATTPPGQQTPVTEVGVPAGTPEVTPMARQPVATPAPRPLAPPAPRADGLPRQLPDGAPLTATPDLLRQALTMPEIAPSDLGGVAVVREPAGAAQTDLDPVGVPDDARLADADVEPLGPMARTPQTADRPMESGVDSLTRYLRDNNVVFTGSVLGPVSVGVFRTADTPMPLVVTLGQTLPNTEIVLTDLTGLKAEFTLADSTQVLSLDLRR